MRPTRESHSMSASNGANSGAERRRFPRREVSNVVELPFLSRAPVVAENVSARGLCVAVAERPEKGREIECEIRFDKAVFKRLLVRVVWVSNTEDETHPWRVGLEILPVDQRARDLEVFLGEYFTRPE